MHSLLASTFWRQIQPETEVVAPQAAHPRVPETEMMALLVPFEPETEKRALLPTCSRMALESSSDQLPWC